MTKDGRWPDNLYFDRRWEEHGALDAYRLGVKYWSTLEDRARWMWKAREFLDGHWHSSVRYAAIQIMLIQQADQAGAFDSVGTADPVEPRLLPSLNSYFDEDGPWADLPQELLDWRDTRWEAIRRSDLERYVDIPAPKEIELKDFEVDLETLAGQFWVYLDGQRYKKYRIGIGGNGHPGAFLSETITTEIDNRIARFEAQVSRAVNATIEAAIAQVMALFPRVTPWGLNRNTGVETTAQTPMRQRVSEADRRLVAANIHDGFSIKIAVNASSPAA